MSDLNALLARARACTHCAADLPLGPRPVVRGQDTARLLIVGQAPGIRVHRSGLPWDDPSGARLRQWLDLTPKVFYDESRVAIVPMGLCYPGENPKGGDNPPAKACAPLWQDAFRHTFTQVRLILLIGLYAQRWHLKDPPPAPTLTATVANWAAYGPAAFPLPHPSWRNSAWIKKNPWFSNSVLPALRHRVHSALHTDHPDEP
jgi:uracil-DNA glycosylase